MPASFQNAGNRGNLRRNAQLGESLKKSARPMQTVPEEAKHEESSPLLLLARRIREEQGAEGLKAFLRAMEPFAAPYELKNLAARFGMEHTSTPQGNTAQQSGFYAGTSGGSSARNDQNGFNFNMNGAQQGAGMGFDPNMIRMMQMMNGMNGAVNMGGGMNGGNMNQMMQLMRLVPLLQSMGKGGADISQIMKMMNM